MPKPKVAISDSSGNEVAVSSNALDVNIAGGASIDIGDVDIHLSGNVPLLGGDGAVAPGVLRVTLADDDPAVVSLDEIEDAVELLEQTVGTHGTTGPSKVLSIGGTTGLGVIKEIAIDNDGQLQVDITSIAAGDNNIGNVDIVTLPASTNTIEVVGDVAEDAAVAGNPVLVGGRYDTSDRSLDNGDVGAIGVTTKGMVKVKVSDWSSDTGDFQSAFSTCGSGHALSTDSIMNAVIMSDVLVAPSNTTNGDWSVLQVDTQGALYTTHGITGMQSDNNEGVDDTTAEVLKASTACKRVDMQADPSNTGYIYVGGSDVSAVKGIRLAPGDFYSIDCNNTADIYVLASVDEEDIHFTYYT